MGVWVVVRDAGMVWLVRSNVNDWNEANCKDGA